MSIGSRTYELLCQLLDLLVDAAFLFAWGLVNWFLHLGLRHFHPSGTVVVVLWLAQGIFAAFTLAIIALHFFRDFKGGAGPHTGLTAVVGKLKDLAIHLTGLVWLSTVLVGWAAVNLGLHILLSFIPAEHLSLIDISERIGEFLTGIATLRKAVMPMYHQFMIIYRRLFP